MSCRLDEGFEWDLDDLGSSLIPLDPSATHSGPKLFGYIPSETYMPFKYDILYCVGCQDI